MAYNNIIPKESFLWDVIDNYCEDIITIKDKDLKFVAWNNAFSTLLNREDSEITGCDIYDIYPFKTAVEAEVLFKDLLKNGGSKSVTVEVIRADGQRRLLRQIATPIIKEGVVTGILSVSRDVTFEEDLKTQLMDMNSKFNTLLEHVPMVVYMKDDQGNYITSSKYGKKFIEKHIDPYIGDVTIELDEPIELIKKEDLNVIETNESSITEKTATDQKGIRHWYRVIKVPVYRKKADMNGLVTIVQNIDAEKQNAEQQELFLAELTHDMKNPILAQISCLEMMLKGSFGALTPEQKEILEITVESSKYMKDLLYSILKSYKYDNGALKLEYRTFNVDTLISKCMNEAIGLAAEKNIERVYKSTLTEEEKEIVADKKHLRTIVSNMINNGLSYGFSNTDYVITTFKKGDNIVFSFENSSPEIPEEIKNHIFDKYVTGARKYHKIGFGLGLYISKKIVDEHNGKIYLTTEGTRNKFTVEIPFRPE